MIAIYANNTGQDIREFEPVILEAIKNNGTFPDDYADIFVLTKTPEGSAVDWILNFA